MALSNRILLVVSNGTVGLWICQQYRDDLDWGVRQALVAAVLWYVTAPSNRIEIPETGMPWNQYSKVAGIVSCID